MKLVPPAPFAIDFLNRVAVLLCVVAVLGGPSSLVAGPGAASPFGGRRVLVIGIDGCRADALRLATNSGLAPHMADLIRNGTVTWNAVAGGPPSPSPSNQPTLSGPGWSSILCGVWTDKHLVTGNTFSPSDFVNYPAFLRRVKEAVPGAFVASAVSWNPIDSGCIGPSQNGSEFMDSRFFTDAQLALASVSGDLADADADGLKTLQEFAFALSPHFAEGGEVLALAKDSSGLEIRYAQRNGGSGTSGVDYRAEGLSYTLEHSADLSPLGWMPVEEAQIEEAHPPVNNGDGTHTVSLRVLPPLSLAPRIFFRLKVGSP